MRVRVLTLLLGVMVGAAFAQAPRPPFPEGAIVCTFDGQGSAVVAGTKWDVFIPYGLKITEAAMVADRSGSAVVEIRKCTYAQYDAGATHPVTGDKINSVTPPTITSGTKSDDAALSAWTTAVNRGDVIEFYVNSATTIRRLTITLKTAR